MLNDCGTGLVELISTWQVWFGFFLTSLLEHLVQNNKSMHDRVAIRYQIMWILWKTTVFLTLKVEYILPCQSWCIHGTLLVYCKVGKLDVRWIKMKSDVAVPIVGGVLLLWGFVRASYLRDQRQCFSWIYRGLASVLA